MRYALQFTLLGERLRFFSEEIFQSQLNTPSPKLKGIWLSSNGQHGISVNFLAKELARQHGFSVLSETPKTRDSQSYFSQNFFSRIIVNNMGGTGENPFARKLWQVRTTLSLASLVFLFVAGLAFYWQQIQYNHQLLEKQQATIRDYRFSLQQLNGHSNLKEIIAPLSELRELHKSYQASSKWLNHLGLMDWRHTEKVKTFYLKQLQHRLLTPLTSLLHEQLQNTEQQHSKNLFDHLQYYLMLFKPTLRDTSQLDKHIILTLSSQNKFESTDKQALILLLSDIWQLEKTTIKPDIPLIDKASQSLSGQLDEKVIYDHIRALPQFSRTLSMKELFGDDFDRFFVVKSIGTESSFPSIFTRNQYQYLNLTALSPLLKQEISNLNRIKKGLPSVSSVEIIRISSKVRKLYFQDYIRAWQDLLSRIALRPTSTLEQLSQQITILYSGERAPLYNLMAIIASETQLADTPSTLNAVETSRQAAYLTQSRKLQKVTNIGQRVNNVLGETTASQAISADNPVIVNRAFKRYADYEQQRSATLNPVLAAILKDLKTISTHYDTTQALFDQAVLVADDKKSNLPALWQQANSDNTLAGRWFKHIADQIWQHFMTGASLYSQKRWQQDVYSFYHQYLYQRFPLSTQSGNDIQLSDFSDFFKPKGLLTQYMSNILQPFLLSTDAGWQIKTLYNQKLSINTYFLNQVSNVKQLQQSLFNADGSLQIKYRMRCTELTSEATGFSLRDNNGRFLYQHGPQLWQKRVWPTDETEQLTASMLNNSNKLSQQSYSGIWAWLRFVFDCHQWHNGERIELAYNYKGYNVNLELALDRRFNPFNKDLYNKISLPKNILR